MSDLNTPTLDALFHELDATRRIAQMLPDYQNEQNALHGYVEQLKEENILLKEKAEGISEQNAKHQDEMKSLRSQLFEAQARANTESTQRIRETGALREQLELQEAKTANLELMNAGLERTIRRIENELSEMKNKYEPAETAGL